MTEQAAAVAPPEDEAVLEPQDGQTEPANDEAEARRNGWKPQEEFKGDPKGWIDAKTFNERGREILPIVQAQNKKLERDIAELRKTMEQAAEHFSKAEQRAYEQAMRDFETRLEEATAADDATAVKKIAKDMAAFEKPATKDKEPANVTEHPVFLEWQATNTWYGADEDLTAYAEGLKLPPAMSLEQQLRVIAERVRKAFPHKFENPRRSGPGAVEGPTGGRKSNGKAFSDLPPDARATCERFIRMGIYKGKKPEEARAQYAKEFFA